MKKLEKDNIYEFGYLRIETLEDGSIKVQTQAPSSILAINPIVSNSILIKSESMRNK